MPSLQHPIDSDATPPRPARGPCDPITTHEAMCAALGVLGLTMPQVLEQIDFNGRHSIERLFLTAAVRFAPTLPERPSYPEIAVVMLARHHSAIADRCNRFEALDARLKNDWIAAVRRTVIDWRAGGRGGLARTDLLPESIAALLDEASASTERANAGRPKRKRSAAAAATPGTGHFHGPRADQQPGD